MVEIRHLSFVLFLVVLIFIGTLVPVSAAEDDAMFYPDIEDGEMLEVPLPSLNDSQEDSDIIPEDTAEYQDLHIGILAGIVFFLGVAAGLIFIKILFDRVKVV